MRNDLDLQAMLAVALGEARSGFEEGGSFTAEVEWLSERGVELVDLDSPECRDLLQRYIIAHPEVWDEDNGVD